MELQPFEVGPERYPMEPGNAFAQNPAKRDTQKRLAAIIGYIALGMPIVLALGGLGLSLFELGEFKESLSAFYYEEMFLGDVFVGCLVFLGAAMFAYQGWHSKIATLASFCGVCLFVVALFPSDGWIILNDGLGRRVVFEAVSDQIHLWASVIVFLILAFFCFFVFTRVRPDQRDENGELIATKRARNRLYQISGAIILVSISLTGLAFQLDAQIVRQYRLVYWGETVCLLAYGVSWMVHGRVFEDLADPSDREDARTR
ncbi:MAG: hypothetical protein AAF291_05365 [Pseudomonadota bacterium]